MAEQQKNGDPNRSTNSSAPKRMTQAPGEGSPGVSEPASGAPESNFAASGALARRKRQYLIAIRTHPGFAASPTDAIHETLQQMEDVEILRRLHPKGFKGLGAGAQLGAQEIIVARMEDQRAEALRQSAPPHVVIEEDARLETGRTVFPVSFAAPWPSRAAPAPRRRREIQFQILGEGDQPLGGAGVTVLGRGFAALGLTDPSGMANVAIFDAEADLDDVGAVYVQPAADHWECLVQRPRLNAAEANVVRLRPLALDGARSADEKRLAWGQKLMGLDPLAAGLTGVGVKIGLIDSGCDNRHPLLRHVTKGADMTRGDGAKARIAPGLSRAPAIRRQASPALRLPPSSTPSNSRRAVVSAI
jgi:subtilisin